MQLFSFSLLIGGGAVLGHLYLYFRLGRHIAPRGRWRRALAILLALMTALLLLRGPIRDLSPDVERLYEEASYTWMAFAISLVCAVALGDVVRLVLGLARWALGRQALSSAPPARTEPAPEPRNPDVPIDEGRRDLVTRALPWAVLASGGLATAYGRYRAFAPPEVSDIALRIPKLPRALDGLTIVQLTDIHVGPYIGRDFIDRLVASANALRPDVIAITGDLVDGDVDMLGHAVAGLARLRARYGTFFVTGNHEYYSGDLEWTRYLERIGLTVLRNRRVEIGDAGGRIDLVGVDDWSGGRRRGGRGYDLDAALEGRDPDRASVLLAHQPMNFEAAAAAGIDLQLSGHTHGGQTFPMTRLVGLRYAYNRGLYRKDDSHIYVSRGCGFWGPPSRIDSPPELVRLTLTT